MTSTTNTINTDIVNTLANQLTNNMISVVNGPSEVKLHIDTEVKNITEQSQSSEESVKSPSTKQRCATLELFRSRTFDKFKSEMFKMGIKTSFNDDYVMTTTSMHVKNSLETHIAREGNGLIISRHTGKIMSYPPHCLRSILNTKETNKYLIKGMYKIFRADDGTMFTLYYDNMHRQHIKSDDNTSSEQGIWRISSNKGYDVTNIKWDERTYGEMIDECLQTVGLSLKELISKLDTNHCYTMCFKHPEIHKFQPCKKIWIIQRRCLDESSPEYLKIYDGSLFNIPSQKIYEYKQSDVKIFYQSAANAYNEFIKSGRKNINYGYIFRSIDQEETGSSSDLYIESSLMNSVKKVLYNHTIIKKCQENHWNKHKCIALINYLDVYNYQQFIEMFPEFMPEMDRLDKQLIEITRLVVEEYMTRNKIDKPIRDLKRLEHKELEEKTKTQFDKIINAILCMSKKTIKTNVKDKNKLSTMFYQFIRNTALFDIFIEL